MNETKIENKRYMLKNRHEGGVFFEDIVSICQRDTNLTKEDIEAIENAAMKLPEIAEREEVDCFINCLRVNGTDSITVAAAYKDNSIYEYNTIGSVVGDNDEPAVMRALRYGLETRDVCGYSFTKTENYRLLQNCAPIFNDGKVIGTYVRERRLTPAELAEWKNCEYHEPDLERCPYLKHMVLAECVTEGIIVLNEEKRVVYRNDNAQKIYSDYGYIHDIQEALYDEISFHGAVHTGPGLDRAKHVAQARSAARIFLVSEYCYFEGEYYYILVLKDISSEKEAEVTLAQKDEVIREAHHRVKNNLQTVYNLLDMQRRRAKDEDVDRALNQAMSRIGSIASAYEMLSREGKENVNVKAMIEKVVNSFRSLISDSALNLTLEVRGAEVFTDMSSATDIALVVNELLQNTAKHAFNTKREGAVTVSIVKRPLYSEIIVSDNGSGFPEEYLITEKTGLGYQIAENIVQHKLKGKILYYSDSTGTSVVFTFKCLENIQEELDSQAAEGGALG